MTYSDQKTGLESGRFGSAPLRKGGVEQGGASGANPLASPCSAPLHSKERSKWSSGAKPCGGGVEQNGVEQAPAIGTEFSLDGQPYRLNRRVPYTRKDGTPTELLVWRPVEPLLDEREAL